MVKGIKEELGTFLSDPANYPGGVAGWHMWSRRPADQKNLLYGRDDMTWPSQMGPTMAAIYPEIKTKADVRALSSHIRSADPCNAIARRVGEDPAPVALQGTSSSLVLLDTMARAAESYIQ